MTPASQTASGAIAVPPGMSGEAGYRLLQCAEKAIPAINGTLVILRLTGREARLLHAQVGPRARRGESEGDDALETKGPPCVRQHFVGLDCDDPTVDRAPVCAKIETMVHDRTEVVLH